MDYLHVPIHSFCLACLTPCSCPVSIGNNFATACFEDRPLQKPHARREVWLGQPYAQLREAIELFTMLAIRNADDLTLEIGKPR